MSGYPTDVGISEKTSNRGLPATTFQIGISLPRRRKEPDPMCIVKHGYKAASSTDKLVGGNVTHFTIVDRGGDVILGDVTRRRCGATREKYISGEAPRQARGDILSVVRYATVFAAQNRYVGAGVQALVHRRVGRDRGFCLHAGNCQVCLQQQQGQQRGYRKIQSTTGRIGL